MFAKNGKGLMGRKSVFNLHALFVTLQRLSSFGERFIKKFLSHKAYGWPEFF